MNKALKYFFFLLYILYLYSFSDRALKFTRQAYEQLSYLLKNMQTEDLGLGLQFCAKALAYY